MSLPGGRSGKLTDEIFELRRTLQDKSSDILAYGYPSDGFDDAAQGLSTLIWGAANRLYIAALRPLPVNVVVDKFRFRVGAAVAGGMFRFSLYSLDTKKQVWRKVPKTEVTQSTASTGRFTINLDAQVSLRPNTIYGLAYGSTTITTTRVRAVSTSTGVLSPVYYLAAHGMSAAMPNLLYLSNLTAETSSTNPVAYYLTPAANLVL